MSPTRYQSNEAGDGLARLGPFRFPAPPVAETGHYLIVTVWSTVKVICEPSFTTTW